MPQSRPLKGHSFPDYGFPFNLTKEYGLDGFTLIEKGKTCSLTISSLAEGYSGNWTCSVNGKGQSVKAESVELVVRNEPPYLLDISTHHNSSVKACTQDLAMMFPNKLAAECLYEVFVGGTLNYTCSFRRNPSSIYENNPTVENSAFLQLDWKFRELTGKCRHGRSVKDV